jgi:hypothetical protein
VICTIAVFLVGVLVSAYSAPASADECRAWAAAEVAQGYAVRREWHKPERRK